MALLFAAELQAVGHFEVMLVIRLAHVGEQAAAMADQFEQTPSAGFIVFVRAQVFGQLTDAAGKDRDLHFGRAGVLIVAMKILYGLGFHFLL